MSEFSFTKIEPAWSDMLYSARGIVQSNMRKRAHKLLALATAQVGKETGGLARSLGVSQRPDAISKVAWWVGSDHRIALLHHNGTRPHIIRSTPTRVLRFPVKGTIVFADDVFHPGTKANRYLTDHLRRIARE